MNTGESELNDLLELEPSDPNSFTKVHPSQLMGVVVGVLVIHTYNVRAT